MVVKNTKRSILVRIVSLEFNETKLNKDYIENIIWYATCGVIYGMVGNYTNICGSSHDGERSNYLISLIKDCRSGKRTWQMTTIAAQPHLYSLW